MHAAGGPEIIAFELAGTERRATDILDSWGPTGVSAARLSLRLDFGYMCTYGVFTALLLEGAQRRLRLRRRRPRVRWGRWAQAACAAAVAADAREGVALLSVLRGLSWPTQDGRVDPGHDGRCRRIAQPTHGRVGEPYVRPRESETPNERSGTGTQPVEKYGRQQSELRHRRPHVHEHCDRSLGRREGLGNNVVRRRVDHCDRR
jgi:hypothetical protein